MRERIFKDSFSTESSVHVLGGQVESRSVYLFLYLFTTPKTDSFQKLYTIYRREMFKVSLSFH